MKKTSLLLWSIIFGLLFLGCKSEEVPGLTTDNFKTTAVVQGNVYYSLGQDFLSSKYIVDKRLTGKGKRIYLDIQSSEYKPGSTGVVTYSAVLDSVGNYKFTIPVKAQGSTTATLRLEQFVAQRQVFDQMTAGAPVFKSQDALFTYSGDISVSKGSLMVQNISYSFTPVAVPTTYDDFITFTGKVNLAYEKGYRDGGLKSATSTNIEVSVNYSELGSQHFGTTVDSNGNYSIKIPVVSKKDAITASFLPISYVANDYVHYTNSATQVTLPGVYAVASGISKTTSQGLSEDVTYNLGTSTLFFQPFNPPATFISSNLAGWVQLDPNVYHYPVTLNGGVQAEYEKSFFVGDYTPVTGKTVTVSVNMGSGYGTQTYILATDNSGKYTLPISLPAKNMTINVSVQTESYGVTNYTHYLSDGTSIQLNGWYQTNYFDITNNAVSINEFNPTYTLDNLYRVFSPVDNSVKDWYTNLIGWYQISGKKSSVLISGSVKKAVEGTPDKTKLLWAVATWSNTINQPFTISISGTTFVGTTGNSGQYNLIYPLSIVLDPTANNNLLISVNSSIAKVTTFNHYQDVTTTSPTQIQGSYTGSIPLTTCTIVDGTTCTVKDCFMFFTPTTIPTGWSNYTWKTN